MKKLLLILLLLFCLTSCKKEVIEKDVYKIIDKYDEEDISISDNNYKSFLGSHKNTTFIATFIEEKNNLGLFVAPYNSSVTLNSGIELENDKLRIKTTVVGIDATNNLILLEGDTSNLDINPVIFDFETYKAKPVYSTYATKENNSFSISRGYVSRVAEYYFDSDVIVSKTLLGSAIYSSDGKLLGITNEIYSNTNDHINKMSKALNSTYLFKSISDMKGEKVVQRRDLGIRVKLVYPMSTEYMLDESIESFMYKIEIAKIEHYSFEKDDYLISINNKENFTLSELQAYMLFAKRHDKLLFEVLRKDSSGNYIKEKIVID